MMYFNTSDSKIYVYGLGLDCDRRAVMSEWRLYYDNGDTFTDTDGGVPYTIAENDTYKITPNITIG